MPAPRGLLATVRKTNGGKRRYQYYANLPSTPMFPLAIPIFLDRSLWLRITALMDRPIAPIIQLKRTEIPPSSERGAELKLDGFRGLADTRTDQRLQGVSQTDLLLWRELLEHRPLSALQS